MSGNQTIITYPSANLNPSTYLTGNERRLALRLGDAGHSPSPAGDLAFGYPAKDQRRLAADVAG